MKLAIPDTAARQHSGGPSPFSVEAASATTEHESRALAMSKPKSPAYSIARHRSCGLPGASFIAPNRLLGLVAIC